MYPEVSLFIDGEWGDGTQRRREPVLNPATEEVVGHVAYADQTDLDRALAAAEAGFGVWRRTSAQERYVILRKAAAILRERQEVIAKLLTLEQGKPLAEAIETGMISINHHGLALPELHFGGVKDSGYGTEGGSEAIDAYLSPKLITQMQL